MPLGVRSRLFFVSFALVLVASLSSAVFLERSLKPVLESRIEGELQRHARTVRETLAVWGGNQNVDEVDPLVDRLGQAVGARVTLVREDGTVLGDSEIPTDEVASIPNHATRPEVLAALADGAGSSRRYSTTLATEMLFFAVRYDLPGGSGVARVALPLHDVDSVMRQLRLFVVLAGLVGLAAATLISLMAAQLLSRRFRSLAQKARSLARGERAPADAGATDEIGHLEGSFDRISLDLDQALTELAGERDRFHTVLEAMGDAVLTVDRDRRIILVNSMAMEFLGLRVAPVGKSLREIIRAPELDEVLFRGALDKTVSLEFELPGSRRGKFWIAGSSPAMTKKVASLSRKMANIGVVSKWYHGAANLNRTAVGRARAGRGSNCSGSDLVEVARHLGGVQQRSGLGDRLLELGLGVAVVDDAAAGLDVERAVLDHPGPERDAGVHLAGGGKIADRARVDAALFLLQLVDDLHRPNFWRARDGARRQACQQS